MECVPIWVIIPVSLIALVHLLIGFVCSSIHMSGRNEDRLAKLNLFAWWLYHAHKLNGIKRGDSTDPWSSHHSYNRIDCVENHFLRCYSVLWNILPVLFVIGIIYALFAVVTTKIGLIAFLAIVGVAGSVFILRVVGKFVLRLAESADKTTKKISKVVNTIKE